MSAYNSSIGDDRRAARQDSAAIDVLGELSVEIGAGLTKSQISAAMNLMRQGVNPSALAAITRELRREAQNNPQPQPHQYHNAQQ
ncbi:hypothetical protein GGI04_004499 [Coemansia thaxteri]|uniref:Mitotic-spindle organizing protein 1 n=1 Tax=Coemansia thaxteri TaxID=2663907 RepID=A0A9W8BNL0_9FUNG|nr:hypothetical protein GGI04_004499 [Coemansia thaxteri]KAJ2006943.1 hypothetical protein H4R26_001084 [Coemansia thaxteri]KAJ2460352.1 hypothetical protein GGI02_005769 [Coemansia sp. RSA 2322]KAJ2487645.1 hypothetical protein EV174_000402 [Coemansia sp. RSA 2320]